MDENKQSVQGMQVRTKNLGCDESNNRRQGKKRDIEKGREEQGST